MADEIMDFTKNNILQQAATAMLAQANMAPQKMYYNFSDKISNGKLIGRALEGASLLYMVVSQRVIQKLPAPKET